MEVTRIESENSDMYRTTTGNKKTTERAKRQMLDEMYN